MLFHFVCFQVFNLGPFEGLGWHDTNNWSLCIWTKHRWWSRKEHLKIDISSVLPDSPVIYCNRFKWFTFERTVLVSEKAKWAQIKTNRVWRLSVSTAASSLLILYVMMKALSVPCYLLSHYIDIKSHFWIVLTFMFASYAVFPWFSPDPICKCRGQTGIQQVPY